MIIGCDLHTRYQQAGGPHHPPRWLVVAAPQLDRVSFLPISEPATQFPKLFVDLRTNWPHHIYKGCTGNGSSVDLSPLFSGFSV
jgi:hypothetical protein